MSCIQFALSNALFWALKHPISSRIYEDTKFWYNTACYRSIFANSKPIHDIIFAFDSPNYTNYFMYLFAWFCMEMMKIKNHSY